jgi:N-dimethylarginine dimethylaminohydrolase
MRSTTAPLRRALLSEPAGGDFAAAGWLGTPDLERLRRQHAAFAELLSGLGVELTVLPASEGLVDACFAYDPVLVTERGVVELRMAKPARLDEPARLVEALGALGIPLAGRLDDGAVADAGDMFWLDERTLAVARGYRTNSAAHEQLAAILAEENAVVERFDLPHHRGPDNLLHLLGVISPMAEGLALVFEPLCPVPLLEALDERGIRRLECDPDEFEHQGCNVLAVRQGVVVMADTAPRSRQILERAGCEVHTYEASEINLGDGGPTCLTQPLLRAH